jgi:quinol monooxygenase YgiN
LTKGALPPGAYGAWTWTTAEGGIPVSFVQVIELETANIEEVERIHREWVEATEGQRTATRAVIGQDRAKPDHYVVIVWFPSYEEAMRNSELQATQSFTAKIADLCNGPMSYIDLDTLRDEAL